MLWVLNWCCVGASGIQCCVGANGIQCCVYASGIQCCVVLVNSVLCGC